MAAVSAHAEARDILQRLLANPKVRIGDTKNVHRKLDVLIKGGFDKLLVISDFDQTITRHKDANGQLCWSTHGVFENCAKKLSLELYNHFQALKTKYLAIEFDAHMTKEEKTPYMLEWWSESHGYVVANRFTRQMIEEAVLTSRVQLRDGAASFLKSVCQRNVPLVCFSAGIGNIIQFFLERQLENSIPENLHIISNFMKFDEEDVCKGFSEPLIHTFNKNSTVVSKTAPYYRSIITRPYVLLLGDSMGDTEMDVGVSGETEALKIGYLNFNIDALYEQYLKAYDIVLIEDSTFAVPTQVFEYINGSITARFDTSNSKSTVQTTVELSS